ncbi:hypothetical protein, partial [Lishizhenia sp.]|uniref:hypothetical protein n=1 Tax=Lishizhenia sp. TaxID=2497594 RepID=UPI00299EE04A
MNTRLLLLTDGFPFGKSETFLETEIEFLAQEFQEIIIVSITQNTKESRLVPYNVQVVPYWPSDGIVTKLKSLFLLFDKRIWEEFSHLKNKYQLSLTKGRFATILMSFQKSKMIRKRISSL